MGFLTKVKDISEFRKINETEKGIIFETLSKMCANDFSILTKDAYKLYISFFNLNPKYKYPPIFLIRSNITYILDIISSQIGVISAGIYFGFFKKNQFLLTLEGSEFLYKHGCFSENQLLYATIEGEKSILYGNVIVRKMVDFVPNELKKYDFLLIMNQAKELIAIAQAQTKFASHFNPSDVIANNLVDKGYYLREEQ